MSLFLRWWLEAMAEVRALREHVGWLEEQWTRAELDADRWYFEANNPDEARARHAALASTASIDAREARLEADQRWREAS